MATQTSKKTAAPAASATTPVALPQSDAAALLASLVAAVRDAGAPKATVGAAEIEFKGDKILLPPGMSYAAAIDNLNRRSAFEETDTQFSETIDVAPLDGAHALYQVLRETFGFVENVAQWGGMFKGWVPPNLITVQTGPNTSASVPWGDVRLPAPIDGIITTSMHQMHDGRAKFAMIARSKRRQEPAIRALFQRVREYLANGGSIYQGKAFSIRFRDSDGDRLEMPEPTFMDVTTIDPDKLVFTPEIARAVHTNLFVPILRHEDLKRNGIPMKRGVLLGGPYGTGKTLTAAVAAKYAQSVGVTFLHVERADEIAEAIGFARPYSTPAVVVFCEDIDSVTGGERDHELNDILNTIDGAPTKGMRLLTLLTTNHIEKITRAMLRPGRLDAVIQVPAPDAIAVEKLLRNYGGESISPNADLTEIAQELDGAIPAIVAEVVKRAKLAQLAMQQPGTALRELSPAALLESARTIRAQRELLATPQVMPPLPVE